MSLPCQYSDVVLLLSLNEDVFFLIYFFSLSGDFNHARTRTPRHAAVRRVIKAIGGNWLPGKRDGFMLNIRC